MKDKNLNTVYLFHIENAAKQFKKYKNAQFKKHDIDITDDQWILLKSIHEVEGISQIDLANRCAKEPASVTRTLDILEKKNWINRKSIPENRRVYSLETTTEGKALVNKIIPLALEIRKQGKMGIKKKEIDQLIELLGKISKNFGE